jgi:hypothetical protein
MDYYRPANYCSQTEELQRIAYQEIHGKPSTDMKKDEPTFNQKFTRDIMDRKMQRYPVSSPPIEIISMECSLPFQQHIPVGSFGSNRSENIW